MSSQGCVSQRRHMHFGNKRSCGKSFLYLSPLDMMPIPGLPPDDALRPRFHVFPRLNQTRARQILPLALHPRCHLLAASILRRYSLPCTPHGALRRFVRAYSAPFEEVCAESTRGRYVAGSVVLGKERPFGQVELLRQIFGFGEDES